MTYLYNVILRDVIVAIKEVLLFLTSFAVKLSVYDWTAVFFVAILPVLLCIIYKEYKKDLLCSFDVNLAYIKYCVIADYSGWFRMDFISWYEIVYIERRKTK